MRGVRWPGYRAEAEGEAEARRGEERDRGARGMKTNGKEEKGGGGGTAGVSIAPVGKDGKEEEKPFGELERDGWGKGRKRAYCSSLPSFSVDGSPSWRRTIYANILLLLLLHPGYHIIRPEWRRGKFVGTSGKTNPRCPNAAKRRRHDLLLATLLPPPSPPPSFRCRQPFLIFFVVEGRL